MFFYKQMINYAVLVILLHKYHLKLGLSSFPAAVACCKRQRDCVCPVIDTVICQCRRRLTPLMYCRCG